MSTCPEDYTSIDTMTTLHLNANMMEFDRYTDITDVSNIKDWIVSYGLSIPETIKDTIDMFIMYTGNGVGHLGVFIQECAFGEITLDTLALQYFLSFMGVSL